MDEKIILQLIDLVKVGGVSAFWLVIFYQVVALLKSFIIPTAWVFCVKFFVEGLAKLLGSLKDDI